MNTNKHYAETVARKTYNCWHCNKVINKGDTYYRSGHRWHKRLGCSITCHDDQVGKWI